MVTDISDSQMGTPTPQAGGPIQGQEKACVHGGPLARPLARRSHLLFCTFQLRSEHEVQAGNPQSQARLPHPRWACSSSIWSFFRHRGWWQWGGDFSNRTQASRYRPHALALSTLKTPSLTHQCRSIGKLNVLKTGFNKCKNRTAKQHFHHH